MEQLSGHMEESVTKEYFGPPKFELLMLFSGVLWTVSISVQGYEAF